MRPGVMGPREGRIVQDGDPVALRGVRLRGCYRILRGGAEWCGVTRVGDLPMVLTME